MKAVGLLSGGLDSRLAVKVLQEQNIEIVCLHNVSIFCTCTSKSSCKLEALKAAEEYDVPLKTINTTKDFLKVIEKPRYGYGKNMNPCLDCRVLLFRKAKEYMEEIGAGFIFTGDVLGERPMSQRKAAMEMIEKNAGLKGYVLRPLSAKLLEPTIPEKEGWVDRNALLKISGRSRKTQFELAEKYDIYDYPCPAGGCLLTDKSFAAKIKDLIENRISLTLDEVKLLKVGRHFRLSPELRLIVGRDETENTHILQLANDSDWLLESRDYKGPIGLLRGDVSDTNKKIASIIVASYGQGRNNSSIWTIFSKPQGEDEELFVSTRIEPDELNKYRIN